jgi:hypothetical protein
MWIDGSSFGNPGKVGFWWLDDQGHRWLLVMPRNQEKKKKKNLKNDIYCLSYFATIFILK